jgi:penicillin amidase
MPGLPVIALGRNQNIAWGGTNMRALSSHLYQLTEDDLKEALVEEQTIKVRWWFDTKVKIRWSEWGPIISDSPLLKSRHPVALKWVGHEVSDD